MAQQHYMLKFLSDKPQIDVEYDKPQIYINEVLMVGDLFSFHNQPDFKKKCVGRLWNRFIQNYGKRILACR